MARVIAWRQFNEVHPHDALGGKTPAEVYRDSERRSLEPLVPSYPPEWKTRLVSKVGTISVNDDVVFVSTSLAGQIVGLKQEGLLRWRAHFFGVDLGTIEIAPLANVLTPDDVSSVTLVNAPHSEAVNASVTQGALLNARPPFDVSEIQQLVWEFAERRQASAVQTKWNRPTVPGSRMSLPCSTGKSGASSGGGGSLSERLRQRRHRRPSRRTHSQNRNGSGHGLKDKARGASSIDVQVTTRYIF